jgi:hypothetical protein
MTEATAPKQPKNCISYKKIASFRSGMKPTESGGRKSTASSTLFAFEKEDGISFVCRARHLDYQNGQVFGDQFRYKLQLRTLKNGRRSFLFYKIRPIGLIGGKAVSTSSPNDMRNKLASVIMKQDSNKKKPRFYDLPRYEVPALYPAQAERLAVFIRKFLRKKNISFKHLSKDPFSLMFQLCYPGAANFDDATIRKAVFGAALLDDPVKLALRTNGKKSRRLVYEAIKAQPQGAQSILRVAKYLRINRSLDSAQRFLELVGQERRDDGGMLCIIDWRFMQDAVYKLKASQLKFLEPLSEREIAYSLLPNHTLYGDTMRMINQVNAAQGQGFDLNAIRYRTLTELHDQLVQMLPGQRRRRGGEAYRFEHYGFDADSISMKFCAQIAEGFKSDEHFVVYPKSSEQLQDFGAKMHNCALAYSSQVKDGRYAIFCLASRESQKLEYMFGYRITKASIKFKSGEFKVESTIERSVVAFDQGVAVCNRSIEPSRLEGVLKKVGDLLDGSEWIMSKTYAIDGF